MGFLGSAVVFSIAYVAMMVPTYVLPYFGSNSMAGAMLGAMAGFGLFPPQFWMHVWTLGVLILIAYVRGQWIGKPYLPVLALLAAVFDMTPGLSAIPLVPTVFHVLVLVLGVMAPKEEVPTTPQFSRWTSPLTWFIVNTVVAIGGIGLSFYIHYQMVQAMGHAAESLKQPNQKRPATTPQLGQMAKPPAPIVESPKAAPVPPVTAPSTVPAPQPSAIPPAAPAQTKPAPTPAPVIPAKPAESVKTNAVVKDLLDDAKKCMGAKKYDCTISNAKAVLKLDAGNSQATDLLRQAKAEQTKSLDRATIE